MVALSMIGTITYEDKYIPKYEIMTHSKAFGRYSNGLVYIGSKYFLKSLTNLNEGDILILDDRNKKDPDMQIYSSYKISDTNVRNEILNILMEYEKKHPSKWERSLNSMKVEWFVHNLLHLFNYRLDNTTDVDFNNADEEIYNVKNNVKRLIKI